MDESRFAEIVIWQVPNPVVGSEHAYKYRMALIADNVCVLRFDNGAGKGDHKDVGAHQVPYVYTTPERLVTDFWQAVDDWRPV